MSYALDDSPELESVLEFEEGGVVGDEDYTVGFEDEDFQALGIDPIQPTLARPGSQEKVATLAARYAAGLPLWHEDDCYDHGPGEKDLMGKR